VGQAEDALAPEVRPVVQPVVRPVVRSEVRLIKDAVVRPALRAPQIRDAVVQAVQQAPVKRMRRRRLRVARRRPGPVRTA
jgi:hypothetical protein